jgi:WD40 repeat protein/DNA-binding XRE family transcriptional regulator
LDLTQEALAHQVGCSTEMIGKIETATRRPSRQVAALLAVALELPPDEQPRFVQWARQSPALIAQAMASAVAPHNGGRQITPLFPAPPVMGPADPQSLGGANPYKGLRAFGEADAPDFFGRESLTQRLAARLAEEAETARFLAVVGPSGSGKSSVVSAGLLPLLRQQQRPGGRGAPWTPLVVELTPGTHPFEELEAGLLRVATNPPATLMAQLRDDERGLARAVKRVLPADKQTELVLVIDQFEELFTLTQDEAARVDFLDSLFAAMADPGSRLWVVATLRADFYDRPLLYAPSGTLLARRTEVVVPLTPGEIYRAITGPAERAGLALEADLAATIMQDVGEQPGTLPLLQYALTELNERRAGRLLTLAAYRASGGVLGALARRAESVYAGLTDGGEQEEARQLFLRLVTLGDGTEDTRRRVRRAELVSAARDEVALQRVLEEFGRYRMLTFDRDALAREPTVEVAHEALLRAWPRLRDWLDASRAALRVQRRLLRAAVEWRAAGQDPSHLAGGARLEQFAGLAASEDLALTGDERAYLAASQAEGDRQAALDRARQTHELALAQQSAAAQRSAAQRLRGLVGALALFLVLAAGLAIFAFSQQAAADSARGTAVANLRHSEALRLAGLANAALQSSPSNEVIGLLAVRSVQTEYTAAGDAILEAAAAVDYPRRVFANAGGGGVFSSDGKYLLDCQQRDFGMAAALFDVASGRQVMTYTAASAVSAVALSPDGAIVAASLHNGAVDLWDRASGRRLQALAAGAEGGQGLAFSPDSTMLLTGGGNNAARLWDVGGGQLIRTFTGHTAPIQGVAFSPDGTRILTGSADKTARLWDTLTAQPVFTFTGHSATVSDVAFSRDGQLILTGGDTTVRLWDATTGPMLRTITGHTGLITSVTFSPDGTMVLSGSEDGTMRLWETASSRELRRFAAQQDSVNGVAFTPDGQAVLEDDNDVAARLWDLHRPRQFPPFAGHVGQIWGVAVSADGTRLLTGGSKVSDGTACLWDVRTGAALQCFAGHEGNVNAVAFSADGNTVMTASGGPENTIRFWDARSGALLRAFAPGEPGQPAPYHAALAPDGATVLGGTREGPILLLDALSGKLLRTLQGHVNRVWRAVYAPDSKTAFTSGLDGTVRQWDLTTGRELRRFTGHVDTENLVLSYDGRILLTGGSDGTAALWDAQTGAPLATYPGLGAPLAITQDGTRVLSRASATSAYLWDRATGQVLRHLTSAAGDFSPATISPDGQVLVAVNPSGALALWAADYHDTLRHLCSRLPRDFSSVERTDYGLAAAAPTCPQP